MNTKTDIITRLTVALAATVLSAGLVACSAEGSGGPSVERTPDTSETPSDECRLLSGWERSNCG